MRSYYIILYILCFNCFDLQAQDIHWSQFMNSPVNLNPALTAVFKGDTRFIANYRNQWSSVPVDYRTFSGAADTKFISPKNPNGLFGGGMIINFDEAGTSEMRAFQIALTGAYTHQLADRHFLTAGVQAGFVQRSFDMGNLRFSNQWDGDVYNPLLSNREPMNHSTAQIFDLSTGLNYHFQVPKKRTSINAGIGLYHINNPSYSFWENDKITLPVRYSGHLTGNVGLGEKTDIVLGAMGQIQAGAQEIVAGTGLKFYINKKKTQEFAIQPGINVRFGDAIIPTLDTYYKMWHIGLSYDINVSDFDVATNGKGGPEISVQYIITKLRAEEFKICPIY